MRHGIEGERVGQSKGVIGRDGDVPFVVVTLNAWRRRIHVTNLDCLRLAVSSDCYWVGYREWVLSYNLNRGGKVAMHLLKRKHV